MNLASSRFVTLVLLASAAALAGCGGTGESPGWPEGALEGQGDTKVSWRETERPWIIGHRGSGTQNGDHIFPENTIPEYGLEQDLIESSTQGMLSEVENRYEAEEEFAFVAWSPHWMNTRFDFNYLEDPQTTLTNEAGDSLTEPSELSSIVRADLQEEDPVAYAFLDELTLTEQQVNELEDEIVRAGDPEEGARAWFENNRDVVQPWVDAANRAQEG